MDEVTIGIISTIIGFIGAIAGTIVGFILSQRATQERDKKQRKALLGTIAAEIDFNRGIARRYLLLINTLHAEGTSDSELVEAFRLKPPIWRRSVWTAHLPTLGTALHPLEVYLASCFYSVLEETDVILHSPAALEFPDTAINNISDLLTSITEDENPFYKSIDPKVRTSLEKINEMD